MHRIKGGENFKSGLKTRAWEKEWSSTVWRRLAGAWREAVGGDERRRVGGTGAAWVRERLRSSGAGAAYAQCVGVRGRRRSGVVAAAAWSGEHGRGGGVRAVVQGRRFREEEERPSEADAWDPRKG